MKTFYIFRHGETFASKAGDISYGENNFNVPLLDEATPTIEKLGDYLKDNTPNSSIKLTSEYFRCVQTSEIVSTKLGTKFVKDSRLNELDSETIAEFTDRLIALLKDIEKSDLEDVLICTHGAVIAALKHLILNGQFSVSKLHDYPKTGVLCVIKDESLQEISFR